MSAFSRRSFLLTAAAGAGLSVLPRQVRADTGATQVRATRRVIDVNGKAADALGLLQPNGAHGLVAEAGKRFHLQLVNELDEHTLVHWHGLTPPSEQDGVPDLSQPALQGGGNYEYDFVLTRPGTNWMHSHVGLQEQQLLAAPLIVRDPAEAQLDEQEVVILLHDFAFRNPAEIFAELAGGMPGMDHGATTPSAGGMAGMDQSSMGGGSAAPSAGGMAGMDHSAMGGSAAAPSAGGMAGMDQSSMGNGAASTTPAQPHLNDIEFDAYLANDRTLNDPEVVRVEAGGRVRLRIINAAAATNFWLDLGMLTGDLVATDGHSIKPVSGSRFPLAIAQRADIRLQLPGGAGAYPIIAVREGDTPRTGIILATAGASVARIPDRARTPTGPVDLELERRLVAAGDPLAVSAGWPVRRHVVDLTGDMMAFVWGFNGRRFGESTPLPVRQRERVEIALVNRTDMSHPVHLHGHPFQVVAIDNVALNGALRDTVLVPIGGSVTIAFAADNPGHWALHCHNLYHMAAGMMTSLRYEA